MLCISRHSNVAKSYWRNAARGSCLPHETLRRQRPLGSMKNKKQTVGEEQQENKLDIKYRFKHEICIHKIIFKLHMCICIWFANLSVFETFEKERLIKLLSQSRDCYRKYQYVYEWYVEYGRICGHMYPQSFFLNSINKNTLKTKRINHHSFFLQVI